MRRPRPANLDFSVAAAGPFSGPHRGSCPGVETTSVRCPILRRWTRCRPEHDRRDPRVQRRGGPVAPPARRRDGTFFRGAGRVVGAGRVHLGCLALRWTRSRFPSGGPRHLRRGEPIPQGRGTRSLDWRGQGHPAHGTAVLECGQRPGAHPGRCASAPPAGVLRGQGLESDARFERYTILRPTGTFLIDTTRTEQP